MSRKDYNLIAGCVRKAKGKDKPLHYFVHVLTLALELNNPKFDATRFREACDLD